MKKANAAIKTTARKGLTCFLRFAEEKG